jgi:hypothetical protein
MSVTISPSQFESSRVASQGSLPRRTKSRPAWPVGKVIRVSVGSYFVGDIHLNGRNQVRSRAASVPVDIVLKVLVQHTRHGETCGQLVGLKDGREFCWFVLEQEQQPQPQPLAEVA